MTTPTDARAGGALDALQRLESALEGRDDSRDDVAQAGLAAAHAEAERIVAAARAAGTDAGRRRRAELLARAQTEAAAIRAAGYAEVERLGARMSVERRQLVAALCGVVLGEEVRSDAGSDDEGADPRPQDGPRAGPG
jgi:hypothetical protein